MSHFTVLVVGNDPEKQLAPYHEFECTGRDDEYVQDVDITEEVANNPDGFVQGLADYGIDEDVVTSESDVDRAGVHKFGYAIVVDGKLVKAIKRTNPNAKWDWYQLGGRWMGYFKLKPGTTGTLGEPGVFENAAEPGWVDSARVVDIDFKGMAKVVTFAVLKDGKWYENSMFNKKEQEDWGTWFERMLQNLDPNTLVSLYDCHI